MATKNAVKVTEKKPFVLIRTYSAGVHYGTLRKRRGKEVELSNARRIWSWEGALSLTEIAVRGITGGRVSCMVPSITLLEAIEIIAITPSAARLLREFPEWTK